MNSRFEQDSAKLSSMIVSFFSRDKKMEYLIEDKNELKKFVEENISQSNFSKRLSDAHRNINANYKIADANEDLLRDKYLKGSSPNKLLDIKGSKQGKMSYNERKLPVQEEINKLIEEIKCFGKISYNDKYKFKKCPIDISEERKYLVSRDYDNILTKKGIDYCWIGTIYENALENNLENKWKITVIKTKLIELLLELLLQTLILILHLL